MILECLMGQEEMSPDEEDWHFNQLAGDWTDSADLEFLELICVMVVAHL
jgi:hypothetical protein